MLTFFAMQMRLMALLALCAERAGTRVPFADVEAALHVESGTAEGWLVKAFGKQLVDGRIDQVGRLPVRQRVLQRRCLASIASKGTATALCLGSRASRPKF